ncbi:MAG: DUF47 family protein, partial [Acidobacteria bacterium]|nr:DUF47 family protein [Acidobacteriota bacterium]
MPRFRLIPREERFFDDFVSLASELKKGAHLLKEMLAGSQPDMQKTDAIKDVEHACDNVTHEIVVRLNRTFVTPLDREDIHALASSLDDVMDSIDAVASVIRLYKIPQVRAGARRLAAIICEAVDLIHEALTKLGQRDGV